MKKPNLKSKPPDGALDLLAATVELEAAPAEGEPQKLRRFSMTAYTGGAMQLAGWRYPVVVDLQGLQVGRQRRPILLDHTRDVDFVMGQTDSIAVMNDQLVVAGQVMGDSPKARQVIALNDRGFAWQASIGARADQVEFVPEGKTSQANGREFAGPVNIARRATLGEISFVVLGADENTSAQIAASRPKENDMDFATWLATANVSASDLRPEDIPDLEARFQTALAAPQREEALEQAANWLRAAVDRKKVIERMRDQVAAEAARIAAIRRHCAGRHSELEAQAIKEGWDEVRTELEVLRASRPQAPAILSGHGGVIDRDVLVAALALGAGVPESAIGGSDQVMTRANQLRRRGFRWAASQIAASRGITLPGEVGDKEWMQAAFSLTDLGGIVGAVANKALQSAFVSAPTVVPAIARSVSHSNFHTHNVFSLVLGGELKPVAPDGEIKHLTLGNESRTRSISTRGAMLTITRNDLINDELGAMVDSATRMGRKAVVSREKVLFTAINATGNGASHFTTARNNYFAGAASSLQLSSLSTAVQMFRDQTGPDGDPVMIEPRILLVPTSLEETAKALMDRSASLIAVALGSTSSKAKEPDANVWAGQFAVVVSPWLNNTTLTGASATAWYLIAEPNDVPAFEVAYLNGIDTPTVEYFGLDATPEVLGVTYRVYWDFGVALAEYRAGVKSKGAA